MNNFFECTSSNWVRYSEYEWKEANGTLYLTPTKTAQPNIYDPLAEYRQIVLNAINIGSMRSPKFSDKDIQEVIRQFAVKYGLLGLMTALPTTPNFMDYEAVYLPKNHFIKKETMPTSDYLNLFFPFDKPDVVKRGIESMWNISNDRVMVALAMAMSDKPMAVNMSFQREYAERYEWIISSLRTWLLPILPQCFIMRIMIKHPPKTACCCNRVWRLSAVLPLPIALHCSTSRR